MIKIWENNYKNIYIHIIYAYMMHIYTHNAIHIYCLYIYIYILHSDTQHFLLVSETKLCFAQRKLKKTKTT